MQQRFHLRTSLISSEKCERSGGKGWEWRGERGYEALMALYLRGFENWSWPKMQMLEVTPQTPVKSNQAVQTTRDRDKVLRGWIVWLHSSMREKDLRLITRTRSWHGWQSNWYQDQIHTFSPAGCETKKWKKGGKLIPAQPKPLRCLWHLHLFTERGQKTDPGRSQPRWLWFPRLLT